MAAVASAVDLRALRRDSAVDTAFLVLSVILVVVIVCTILLLFKGVSGAMESQHTDERHQEQVIANLRPGSRVVVLVPHAGAGYQITCLDRQV